MKITFDPMKRDDVLRERGVDILYAALIFEGETLDVVDERHDYGEKRIISIGKVGDEYYTVVHVDHDEPIRIVTAWKGGRRAKKKYDDRHA
ncbi:BrnT family toxin [Jiella avicenniae]|uniref:BrnT family toxin n=1 Tax=Jiella avicenniae TaxID=2907202 RepID=A0A9X1NYP6_9HYPH|nr:BrnT family toxin [Jiella avicenniae]MCE7027323.1 BrnT family toxin [Jiella avicenniae]